MTRMRVFIMAWFFLVGIIGTGLIGPVRVDVEREYGLSHSAFGLRLALTQILFSACLLLAVAPLLRTIRRVIVMALSLALGCVALAIVFLTHSAFGFYAGWAAMMASQMLSSTTNNLSMDLWPANPRRGLLLLHSWKGAGKVGGPLLAAGCLATLGWRGGYQAAAALNGALLAGLFFCWKDAWRLDAQNLPASQTPPACASEQGDASAARSAFANPLNWLCVLLFGLIAGGEAVVSTLAPAFFIHVRGFSSEAASALLAVHLLGLVAGRFAFSAVSERFGNSRIIAICLATGLFVFPAVLIDRPLVCAASLFILGVQFSATWPAFYEQTTRLLHADRDPLAYGSTLGNTLGYSACVAVSSVIADRSLAWAVIFGPLVLWMFGALYFLTRLSHPPADSASQLERSGPR